MPVIKLLETWTMKKIKNLENIMLSEKNPATKSTYCFISFIWNMKFYNRQIDRDRKKVPDCQKWGGCCGMGSVCSRYSISFWGDKNNWVVVVKLNRLNTMNVDFIWVNLGYVNYISMTMLEIHQLWSIVSYRRDGNSYTYLLVHLDDVCILIFLPLVPPAAYYFTQLFMWKSSLWMTQP